MVALNTKRKQIVAGLLYLVTLFLMMAIRQYYTWYMPESPEITSGKTIAAHVNYGKIVYVTPLEQKILYASYVIIAMQFIAAAIVYIIIHRRRNAS